MKYNLVKENTKIIIDISDKIVSKDYESIKMICDNLVKEKSDVSIIYSAYILIANVHELSETYNMLNSYIKIYFN